MEKNTKCLRNGCERWLWAKDNGYLPLLECETCGFNVLEDARRKKIPLTLCEDGLRRKIISRKGETNDD